MKAWLTSIFLLAAILAGSALNCRVMERDVSRWQSQLEQAESAAAAENWSGARSALSQSYEDWFARQTRLHITAEHSVVDGADAMYRRAAAFAAAEEPSEFQAELAGLKHQLRLLAEMEQFSVKNVL